MKKIVITMIACVTTVTAIMLAFKYKRDKEYESSKLV